METEVTPAVTGPARAATETPAAEVKVELLTPEPGAITKRFINSDEVGKEERRKEQGR